MTLYTSLSAFDAMKKMKYPFKFFFFVALRMKTLATTLFAYSITLLSSIVLAQDKSAAKILINEGIALHDSGKYAQALAKYQEALRKDTSNLQAQYETAYTLAASGKPDQAIPYLERIAPSNTYAAAYDLLASIYDDKNDFVKAEAYYKQGIIAFPNFQRLRFNLGISYLRQKRYVEAERASIKAIELDPKHASSQRVYALATYGQEKRGVSLLAWCSFLMLEPQTKHSAEGYQYIQKILSYGITPTSEKSVTINFSTKDLESPNITMPLAVLAATSGKKGLTSLDSLTLQLKRIFEISEGFDGKKTDTFYKKFFSEYFKNLAGSPNMPAFTHLISLSIYPEDNLKWFKENNTQLSSLNYWMQSTKREF